MFCLYIEDIKPTKIKKRNRVISSSSESENDVQNNSKENANISDNEIDERLPKTPEKKTNGTVKIDENDSPQQEKKANGVVKTVEENSESSKKTPEKKLNSFFGKLLKVRDALERFQNLLRFQHQKNQNLQ